MKEIIIRAEMNETEAGKKKLNELKSWISKRVNEKDKHQSSLPRKGKKKIQINAITNLKSRRLLVTIS